MSRRIMISQMNDISRNIMGNPKRQYIKKYWDSETIERHINNCYLGNKCLLNINEVEK